MIETWRQCVTTIGVSDGTTGLFFLAVGPFRAGEIREVRFISTVPVGSAIVDASIVVSAGGGRTGENFRTGTPIFMAGDQRNVVGQPSYAFRATATPMAPMVFPLAIRVDTGARYVLLGVNIQAAYVVYLVCTVTVIGFARMGANGLGVEDGLDK